MAVLACICPSCGCFDRFVTQHCACAIRRIPDIPEREAMLTETTVELIGRVLRMCKKDRTREPGWFARWIADQKLQIVILRAEFIRRDTDLFIGRIYYRWPESRQSFFPWMRKSCKKHERAAIFERCENLEMAVDRLMYHVPLRF